MLPRFDHVYVCSEADRVEVAQQCGCENLAVLPNGVRIPARVPAKRAGGPFTLLFVGNFGYYPNDDAATFFCAEVLPRLRAARARGSRDARRIAPVTGRSGRCRRTPDVTVTGSVPSVAPYYRDADVVVVPVRAGAARASSCWRPSATVVRSSPPRWEPRGSRSATAWSCCWPTLRPMLPQRCAELMKRPALRRRLVDNAAAFVAARHSPRTVLAAAAPIAPAGARVSRSGDLMNATSSQPSGRDGRRDTEGRR